jgi:hypothetical protein
VEFDGCDCSHGPAPEKELGNVVLAMEVFD